jgi:hypothetical protein
MDLEVAGASAAVPTWGFGIVGTVEHQMVAAGFSKKVATALA